MNGEHTKPREALSEDRRNLPKLLREAERRVNARVFKTGGDDALASIPANRDRDVDLLLMEAADTIEAMASVGIRQEREIERLREVVTFPLITPEAPSTLCIRVLAEHEKGQPVNAQDLINALMWRVKNQREQLARLNRRVEEYRTDD